ncbi:peptidoglycan editing factor PgeF [Pulveribacter suum]|uniref:Purine nucleoside phosphorylase n=1 Tax=Pulveribacter suum TaxID=2116657 RepID=A0A2P1NLB1_9BURK|nr:peptidoglycan editing factor PgeF [Pulveribacter suum]AVP57842.1 peptidoglycan editing factor PgeF [Pulveribacter suum]
MPLQLPHDWIAPDWPAHLRVRAFCTTRRGGVSAPPLDSLNLGQFVGDDPQAVAANWAAVQTVLDSEGGPVHTVRTLQVHGSRVVAAHSGTPAGLEADACTTAEPGVACVTMAADCLPVLLADCAGTRVAAAHAGWRGLAGGVLEAALQPFWPPAPVHQAPAAINSGAQVLAWIGPGIGPQAFEVGAEVREAFVAHDPAAAAHFTARPGGKFLADLPALARQRLRAAGVSAVYGNDSSPAWCTAGQPSRFFSHRRDSAVLGRSGRMAACIWLAA